MSIVAHTIENASVDLSSATSPAFGRRPAGAGHLPPLGIVGRIPSKASGSAPSPTARYYLRFALQAAARGLMPREAVSYCLRRPIPNLYPNIPVDMRKDRPTRSTVDVWQVPATQTAQYGGLMTCKSVWMCPVCSAKISERRREELTLGLSNWSARGSGGRVLLVTYTMQHKIGDDLWSVLDRLKQARERLQSGRDWQDFRKKYGVVGQVRALEVTYGKNGWHAHIHCLLFFSSEVAIIPFEEEIKTMWILAAAFAGGYASYENGCDVRFSDKDISEYIAKFGREPKWTAAHELAKSVSKIGSEGGRTPLELLRDHLYGDDAAGRLWQEYAKEFKGQRQLWFSRGLKSMLGIVDKTDEEIADEIEQSAVLFAELTQDQWKCILGLDIRADLLDIASRGDHTEFWLYLWRLGVPNVPVYAFPVGTLTLEKGVPEWAKKE